MKEIQLKTGVLIIPKDWIVIENIPLNEADYAGVVETRNGNGIIPHFIYLGQTRESINTLTDKERRRILKMCACKSFSFAITLIQYYLTPKDENGIPRNKRRYDKMRQPGLFTIFDRGEFDLKDWSYPYGAMIVRGESNGEE